MDRRETLKTLLAGSVAGATLSVTGCAPSTEIEKSVDKKEEFYGRTPSEKAWDEKIKSEAYLNEYELNTIATLCDIILPATITAGSANEAEVPAFIDFIVKDIPRNQLPLRGGLMWLDGESNKRFNKSFDTSTQSEQIAIIDDIAYPDNEGKKPDMAPGIKFFDLLRNLVLTGYYTTKIGIDDLGYKGNVPNIWDGVPEEVLAEHDVDYDPVWVAKCVDQDKRDIMAEWDENGNLIT